MRYIEVRPEIEGVAVFSSKQAPFLLANAKVQVKQGFGPRHPFIVDLLDWAFLHGSTQSYPLPFMFRSREKSRAKLQEPFGYILKNGGSPMQKAPLLEARRQGPIFCPVLAFSVPQPCSAIPGIGSVASLAMLLDVPQGRVRIIREEAGWGKPPR